MPTLTIAAGSLRLLRDALLTSDSGHGRARLRTAGEETGSLLVQHFRHRLAERTGLEDPQWLDARWLAPLLTEFLAEMGWGAASLVALGDEALLVDAPEWAEAAPGEGSRAGCHFSVGMLGALLSGIAGTKVTVVEVECRSGGASACRFVAGHEDLLATLRDLTAAGGDWRTALTTAHPA